MVPYRLCCYFAFPSSQTPSLLPCKYCMYAQCISAMLLQGKGPQISEYHPEQIDCRSGRTLLPSQTWHIFLGFELNVKKKEINAVIVLNFDMQLQFPSELLLKKKLNQPPTPNPSSFRSGWQVGIFTRSPELTTNQGWIKRKPVK